MPVDISPKDDPIWNYLVERKTPVTKEKIAKHFLISKSNASRSLIFLEKNGLLDVIKIGNVKYYKVKE